MWQPICPNATLNATVENARQRVILARSDPPRCHHDRSAASQAGPGRIASFRLPYAQALGAGLRLDPAEGACIAGIDCTRSIARQPVGKHGRVDHRVLHPYIAKQSPFKIGVRGVPFEEDLNALYP